MMAPPTERVFVIDLKEVRERFLRIPPEVRRPEIVIPGDYEDGEVLDMELHSLLPYMTEKAHAGDSVHRYTEDFFDNFEEPLDPETKITSEVRRLLNRYLECINDLAEHLWWEFVSHGVYDQDGKLVGEFDKIIQDNLLILRRNKN